MTDHPPCADPTCREHGVAASNARTSAFYAEHPRGEPSQWEAAPRTGSRVVDCPGCGSETVVYVFDGDDTAAVDTHYAETGWIGRDGGPVWRDGEDLVTVCTAVHVNREETCGETIRFTPEAEWPAPDTPDSHPGAQPILDSEPTAP